MGREEINLKKFLYTYLKRIHNIYIEGNFREESFYSSLEELLKNVSQFFSKDEAVQQLSKPYKNCLCPYKKRFFSYPAL